MRLIDARYQFGAWIVACACAAMFVDCYMRPEEISLSELGVTDSIGDRVSLPYSEAWKRNGQTVAIIGDVAGGGVPVVEISPLPAYGQFKIVANGIHDWSSNCVGVWCRMVTPPPNGLPQFGPIRATGVLTVLKISARDGTLQPLYLLDVTSIDSGTGNPGESDTYIILATLAAVTAFFITCRRIILASRRANRIARNVCPNCGYDLRATPVKCPECGLTVLPQGKSFIARYSDETKGGTTRGDTNLNP